jgi:hypothetical protein
MLSGEYYALWSKPINGKIANRSRICRVIGRTRPLEDLRYVHWMYMVVKAMYKHMQEGHNHECYEWYYECYEWYYECYEWYYR